MYGWLWLWFVVLTQDIRCLAHPCLAVRWWHVAMTRPPWDEGLPDFFYWDAVAALGCRLLQTSVAAWCPLLSCWPGHWPRQYYCDGIKHKSMIETNFSNYYMDCIWHLIFTACTSKFRITSRHLFNRFYKKLIWGTLAHNAIIPAGYADR